MFVLDRLSLSLDPDKIIPAIFQGKTPQKDWSEKVQVAIEQITPLLRPAAVYEVYGIETVEGERLVLTRPGSTHGKQLYLGPHADMLDRAELAVVSVVTLGEKIDGQIAGLNAIGQILEAYLFDSVAIYALLQVSRAVFRQVEDLAAARGHGVGSVMSPGAIEGWPLEEQARLCGLLPMAQIGVRLNPSGVLIPQKSVSFLVGTGPSYSSKKVEIPCQICTNEGSCWCTY